MGEEANISKAQYLHGNCGRKCGGYKWESHAHYPGRSDALPLATVAARRRDGVSEVSRGRITVGYELMERWEVSPKQEGLNVKEDK